MKHLRSTLLLAAVTATSITMIVAAVTPGSATPGIGFTSTTLARGTLDTTNGILFHENTDVVVAQNTISPGGSSGWHSHPGGAVIVVAQGTITWYHVNGNKCNAVLLQAGQTFFERPDQLVNAVNTGSSTAVVYVTFPSVPVGGSPRTEEANPEVCSGV